MKSLIVYDSRFGNTAEIARAIGAGMPGETRIASVGEVSPENLPPSDLLIVGAPTHAGRASAPMQDWLRRLPDQALAGRQFAVFDTRVQPAKRNLFLRALTGILGFAAPRMEKVLESKAHRDALGCEGFIVEGEKGPLRAGEAERAGEWGAWLAAR